ncbi:MAG: hypothetical protein IKC01_06340, partial [Clostridia bacterium]|nr:hypothetical protein [Clostridia bacterium]
MKKFLSVLLAVLMLVAIIPATSMTIIANAITITSTALLYGDSDGLTRAEWLHNLAVVGDLDMDENAHMDNYFSDLTSKHKYYNDVLLNLQYGLIDIQAGSELRPDDQLTRDFAVSTLNALLSFQVDESESYTFSDASVLWSYTEETEAITEGEGEVTEGTDTGDESTGSESTDEDIYADFIEQDAAAKLVTEQRLKDSAQIAINRGWVELIDGAFSPETVVTKTEIEKMLEDAIDVLEITVIDENYENVFEFTEDVIVVPDGTVVSEDIENNTVSITDCPVELTVGNKFAVYYNGIPDVYLAEEITVVENVTTITVSEVADEEAFTKVDAQGVIYDPSQIEVIPAEGAEVTVTEVVEEATVIAEPENANAFISYPEMKLSPGRINLCKISVTKELKINSECKISVKLELNNPYVSYYANKDYFESYLFCNDVKIEISGSANAMPDDVPLCVVAVGGIGTFEINLTYELGGKAKYITKGGMMIGVRGAPFESCRNLTKYVQHYQYVEAEACGSAGLNFSFNIKAPCVHAKLYAEVGVKGSVALKKYLDQTLPKMCCHMYACLYAKAGFYLKLGFSEWSTKYQAEKDIYNYKNSPYKVVQHYEDGVIVSECTKGQNPNVDMVNYDYFTRTNSRWFGSGWSGWNGTSGINAANEIVPVFSYTLNELNEATIT